MQPGDKMQSHRDLTTNGNQAEIDMYNLNEAIPKDVKLNLANLLMIDEKLQQLFEQLKKSSST
jgi:hypothetical protein